MARVKKGVNAHKRHKKILKLAKGFYGQKSKVFKAANQAEMRNALEKATVLTSADLKRMLRSIAK